MFFLLQIFNYIICLVSLEKNTEFIQIRDKLIT